MTDTLQIEQPATRAHALSDEERQPCEVWTRVMGYHRPAASFNTGKQGEFQERRYFEESRCGGAARA
jgi:anaerobic ribonucleoside-triphosphate reductase